MFGSGLIRGECAAQEKCAAKAFCIQDGGKARETDSAWVAQLVERVLGKDEVTGSIPVPGSRSCVVLRLGSLRGLSGGNSTVESHSSKVMVAGSNPVPRSRF
jgi:hypothetical protein